MHSQKESITVRKLGQWKNEGQDALPHAHERIRKLSKLSVLLLTLKVTHAAKMFSTLQDWLDFVSDPHCPLFDGSSRGPDPSPLDETAAASIDPFGDDDGGGGGFPCSAAAAAAAGGGEVKSYRGGRDDDGRYHRGGTVVFANGASLLCDFDHGVRHGDGVVISPSNNITRLCGSYVNGSIEGKVTLVSFI